VEVDRLWRTAIQPTTRATYTTGLQCFRRFTLMTGVVQGGLFPNVDENLIIRFTAHCHQQLHLTHSTIKLYLAGIRFCYLEAGYRNPFIDIHGTPYERLPIILRSIKKSTNISTLTRLPIDATVLTQICAALRAGLFGPYSDLLLETVCTTAFFGFLRCGEFTVTKRFDSACNLCMEDITFKQDRCILKLKSSKTDVFRLGVLIPLFTRNHSICPVNILHRYYQVRIMNGANPLDPLFITSDGSPLNRDNFIRMLKIVLSRLGLNERLYSGHSFRVGAACSGSSARLEDYLIKTLGRWSSNCYIRYIRTPDEVIRDAQNSLLP
jgi:hypothetical protein